MAKQQNNSNTKDKNQEGLGKAVSIVVISIFVVMVGIIIGFPYYRVFVTPWQQTILQVGETSFSMRDVVKRMRLQLAGSGKNQIEFATRVIGEIQDRELIRQEAVRRHINVSDHEIDQEVRGRVSASATGEGEFEDLYGAMLRGLGLDEEEFRQWVRLDLFRDKLLHEFMGRIPHTVEQVHVHAIVAGTAEGGEEIRDRLEKGEDFYRLAKEESIDLKSAKRGGDLGWFPKGVDDLTAMGQIRAMGILTKTEEESEKFQDKIMAGDDFAETARLNSLDDQSRDKGGYLGWVSTDYRTGKQYAAESYDLEPGDLSQPMDTHEGFWLIKLIEKSPEGKIIDDIAFDLNIGQVTPPLYTIKGYYLLKVTARDKKRPLTKQHRMILANKALNHWLLESSQKGSKEGWIRWNWGSDSFNWAMAHLD